jgi:hypothetical protein
MSIANLVRETSVNPGTGTTVTLAGATPGRVTFLQGYPAGSTAYYGITDGTQTEFQQGTVQAGTPATLTRGTPLWTTSGSLTRLNFTGTVTVYSVLPAERAVWKDPSGNFAVAGGIWGSQIIAQGVGGGVGTSSLQAGGANPGYVDFRTPGAVRVGYVGYSDGASRLVLMAEAGWGWRVLGASFFVAPNAVMEAALTVNGGLWANGGLTTPALQVNGNATVTAYMTTTHATVNGTIYLKGSLLPDIGVPLYLYNHSEASAAYWQAEPSTGHCYLVTGTVGRVQRLIAYANGGGYLQGGWNIDGITLAGNEVLHLGMGPHAIGSYVEAQCWSQAGYGEAKAGGELKPSDSSGWGGGSLGGTWRCMGQNQGSGTVTLWQRIA